MADFIVGTRKLDVKHGKDLKYLTNHYTTQSLYNEGSHSTVSCNKRLYIFIVVIELP